MLKLLDASSSKRITANLPSSMPHVPWAHLLTRLPLLSSNGLFIWREEDPSTRKTLEGGTTFGWVLYIQKLLSVWLPSRRGKQMTGNKNKNAIGHFRVPQDLCFKTRVAAQSLIRKSFFILMQIKLIFTRRVVHLASFWKWGFLELGSGLFGPFYCLYWR